MPKAFRLIPWRGWGRRIYVVHGCPATPVQSPITTGEEQRCHGRMVGGAQPHLPSCKSRDKARLFLEVKCQREQPWNWQCCLGERHGGRDSEAAIYYNKMCAITCYLSFIDLPDVHTHHFFFKEQFFKIPLQNGVDTTLSASQLLLGKLSPDRAGPAGCPWVCAGKALPLLWER